MASFDRNHWHGLTEITSEKDSEELKKLGNRIKQLRIAKGYTSYEPFAYEHDIPRAQYGRYERGANITYLNLLKLTKAFNISLDELFSDGFDNDL